MVVVTGNMEADCWRSLVGGVGYLERRWCLSGCDYRLCIRSETSSAVGLHWVSVLWPSGDYFDINTSVFILLGGGAC